MIMDKWANKWLSTHKEATVQEFAIALSKKTTCILVTSLIIEIVVFIAVIVIVSFLK